MHRDKITPFCNLWMLICLEYYMLRTGRSDNMKSWAHFTNRLWAHNPNLVKLCTVLIWNLMIRSGHNFAHAMTAQLLRHVQYCGLIGSLKIKIRSTRSFTRFQLWAHKPCVKWIPFGQDISWKTSDKTSRIKRSWSLLIVIYLAKPLPQLMIWFSVKLNPETEHQLNINWNGHFPFCSAEMTIHLKSYLL